jgi:hypothetical protein
MGIILVPVLVLYTCISDYCRANICSDILERMYEGESVNKSQMDINVKKMLHMNQEKKILDISTKIDTLVPSLYQCVETRNIEVS